MGRRPLAKQAPAQVPTAGFTPDVQVHVNTLAKLVLAEAEKRIKERIENKEMADMDLSTLLQEVGKILKAIKGPATSITAIQLPGAPQHQPAEPKRVKAIEDAAQDPVALEALRGHAEKYLAEEK